MAALASINTKTKLFLDARLKVTSTESARIALECRRVQKRENMRADRGKRAAVGGKVFAGYVGEAAHFV